MKNIIARVFVAAVGAAVMVTACSKDGNASHLFSSDGVLGKLALATHGAPLDPCAYLAASEAERFLGKLKMPPYRATDDGAGDVNGGYCMYLASDGKQILVRVSANSGAGKMIQGVPNALGGALAKGGATGMDTTAHRVMADTKGPWDDATWIPGGSLFVTKGAQEGQVDVSGSTGQQKEAVAVATLMVARFGHPLDYDGAKAVAMARKPKAHPASACDVLSTAQVEAAIGHLSGAPEAEGGTSCKYHVATAQGTRTYSVQYVWQGGRKNYNMLVHSGSTLGSVMGGGMPTDAMSSIPADANTRKMIGGLMKMVGGGDPTAATGAASQVGLKTDTTLAGPWDNASLQHGTQLFAVKNDVMVGMDLQSADYEKAKALLVAICEKL
ncbi:MAG TPA: hypothetical protein VGM82_23550 [Gemmatimonadaceae bacterium]|jgi:hypothetical protein